MKTEKEKNKIKISYSPFSGRGGLSVGAGTFYTSFNIIKKMMMQFKKEKVDILVSNPPYMANKYVDFVSDEDFLECVKRVCGAYPDITKKRDLKALQKNSLDVFKSVFDIFNTKITVNEWLDFEKIRQPDKSVSNKIGEFHQMLLGKVKGWEDLGTGHSLGIDLKNNKNTIFIELKNKHNTVKKKNLKNLFDELEKLANQYKKVTIYYAYIIPKDPSSGERIWKVPKKNSHPRIKEAWGNRVYEIVTGDKNSLKATWEALPKAIQDVKSTKHSLSSKEQKELLELYDTTIKD